MAELDASAAPATEISQEEMKKRLALSQRLSMAFGEIVTVLMRSQGHKHLSLADLEWAVAPAVITGQFSLAEAQSKSNGMVAPVAVVTWASVNEDIDQRLMAGIDHPVRLAVQDWRSGPILWVMDAIGDPRVIGSIFERLVQNEWKGQPAKMRTRNPEGKPVIATIAAKQAS